MPKLTIQELAKMRDEARKNVLLREGGQYRVRTIVHMGTCGIASGAREVMKALLEAVEKSGISDVFVGTSGCAGLCSSEPMATVEIIGEAPIKYVFLTDERMRRIFKEHVLEGRPVNEYALAVGLEKTP